MILAETKANEFAPATLVHLYQFQPPYCSDDLGTSAASNLLEDEPHNFTVAFSITLVVFVGGDAGQQWSLVDLQESLLSHTPHYSTVPSALTIDKTAAKWDTFIFLFEIKL